MVYRQLASDEPRATAHLALVARLGATAGRPAPVLSATSAEFAASHRHVPPGCSPFVVLHPGACDPTRRWPAKRFAALGRHLTDWLAVVVTGSTAERELVHAVAAGVPGAQVCTELTLPALIGVLSRARLVGGQRHRADASGCGPGHSDGGDLPGGGRSRLWATRRAPPGMRGRHFCRSVVPGCPHGRPAASARPGVSSWTVTATKRRRSSS